jgi:peptide/nickel transport system ATP-binding protein
MGDSILNVEGLQVTFATADGPLKAVDGVSFDLEPGRTLGLVGESGCGKTVTALSLLGLVPPPGRIVGGTVRFDGRDLLGLDEKALDVIRGDRISMIFQEPATALNPVFTVGEQIAETLRIHRHRGRVEAAASAVALLERVGIADPAARAESYPHHLSGGMRQRAMIAMALACRPDVLIADEPTTALDVTIQAQILDLVLDLQRDMGMAVLFISHNLGVISEVADEIAVMYAGRMVEYAPAEALFADPLHPYTVGLIETLPRAERRRKRLPAIPGMVPNLLNPPPGCLFSTRCAHADDACRAAHPALEETRPGRWAACFKAGP